MSDVVVIRNSRTGEKPPSHPINKRGEFYGMRLFFDGNSKIAYSDDLDAIYDFVIPNYSSKNDEERLKARVIYALDLQRLIQGTIELDWGETPEWETLEDWQKKVLKGEYNETQPVFVRDFWKETLKDGWKPEDVPEGEKLDIWQAKVPLVLTDVLYEPFSDYPRPLGNPAEDNIIWIKAADEEDFLSSLNFYGQTTFQWKRRESLDDELLGDEDI